MLTPRELQLLAAVGASLRVRGVAPTYRELAQVLGLLYPSAVSSFLMRLRDKGLLTPASDRSNRGAGRAVFLSEQGVDLLEDLAGEAFDDLRRIAPAAERRGGDGNEAWRSLAAGD